MNIFATSPSPLLSAFALDDKRINKMIVESAQMLSTALRKHGVEHKLLYKPCHANHPCTLWAGATRENFRWLCSHALSMCLIYQGLRKRVHACEKVILLAARKTARIPKGNLLVFADCTEFKSANGSVLDHYRDFMNLKWNKRDKRKPTWIGRKPPVWKESIYG